MRAAGVGAAVAAVPGAVLASGAGAVPNTFVNDLGADIVGAHDAQQADPDADLFNQETDIVGPHDNVADDNNVIVTDVAP